MTGRTRFRLLVGIVGVAVTVVALTMLFNARNGRIESSSAALAAVSFPVGTDYAGTVTKLNVQVGDEVAAGAPLFELKSATLAKDIELEAFDPANAPYQVLGGNTIVIAATEAGRVEKVDYTVGAFVPANSEMATLQRAGSLYVEAEFVLTPRDYARLPPGTTVDVILPSNETVQAKAGRVKVATDDGEALTEVEAYSPALAELKADGLFAVGTPVTATLHLRNDGIVTDATNWLMQALGLDS